MLILPLDQVAEVSYRFWQCDYRSTDTHNRCKHWAVVQVLYRQADGWDAVSMLCGEHRHLYVWWGQELK